MNVNLKDYRCWCSCLDGMQKIWNLCSIDNDGWIYWINSNGLKKSPFKRIAFHLICLCALICGVRPSDGISVKIYFVPVEREIYCLPFYTHHIHLVHYQYYITVTTKVTVSLAVLQPRISSCILRTINTWYTAYLPLLRPYV